MDSKAQSVTYEAMVSTAECLPNVHLASRRYDVRWGEFSVLAPELTCMKDLLKHNWKYFINLTGKCLKICFDIKMNNSNHENDC